MSTVTTPIADPVAEAERLVAAGADQEIPLRVMGGVAVAIRCASAHRPPLHRQYADIDVVAPARKGRAIRELLETLGYEPDHAFNALHGGHRLYFWDPVNERQVDVFLDKVEMCHAFDFSKRIDIDRQTLSLADLLLLKLQIVETNQKDYLDMLALLSAVEQAAKSRRWKLRAKVGERRRWYALPEEEH